MNEDATIARIFGWEGPTSVTRSLDQKVWVSWFPVNAKNAVLYSGANKARIGNVPLSAALEEEYNKQKKTK